MASMSATGFEGYFLSHSRLWIASASGFTEEVRGLLEEGIENIDQMEGWGPFRGTALMEAVRRGHADVAEMLIEAGADVSFVDVGGSPLLHVAARKEPQDIAIRMVNSIIRGGANVNATNDRGWTPLHESVNIGYVEVSNILLVAGGDLSARNGDNNGVLNIAVKSGCKIMVENMITQGAHSSYRDYSGYTPMHWAVILHGAEMVKLLCDGGCDVVSRDYKRRTPEKLAIREKKPEVAAILKAEVVRREAVAEAERRARCEAFAMGNHERLGVESQVLSLDAGVVRMVLERM